jgi:hypothetical protein
LDEILNACEEAGIQAILLKGAALFHLVYPEPGLRPMRDIDLLVRPEQVMILKQILNTLGYHARLRARHWSIPQHHQPPVTRELGGVPIDVEAHTELFDEFWQASFPPARALFDRARPFAFMTHTAYSLSLEDMLAHIYRHMTIDEARLIAIADLVSLSERFADEIDWEAVRMRSPEVLGGLSLFHFLTPLSARLIEKAALQIGREPPDAGVDFQGWPRRTFNDWQRTGPIRWVINTFFPSEWWLRLYYGKGSTGSIAWERWFRHPFEIVRWAWRRLKARISSHP